MGPNLKRLSTTCKKLDAYCGGHSGSLAAAAVRDVMKMRAQSRAVPVGEAGMVGIERQQCRQQENAACGKRNDKMGHASWLSWPNFEPQNRRRYGRHTKQQDGVKTY